MPRKSTEAQVSELLRNARMRPILPPDLPAAELVIWEATVSAVPVGWFQPEHEPLLSQYVAHIARARAIEKRIANEDTGTAAYCRLARAAAIESRAITALARSLRLTKHSRVRADVADSMAKKTPRGKPPWET